MVAEQSNLITLLVNMDKKLDAYRHELLERIDANQNKQEQTAERLSEKIENLRADIRKEVQDLQNKVESHEHTIGWIKKSGATAGVALVTSLVSTAAQWWKHVGK